ncbi:MAG: porin [bacterium]|nr:porin [bacterium]
MKMFSWLAVCFLVVVSLSFAAEPGMDSAVVKKDTADKFYVITGNPVKLSGYTHIRYRQDKSINDSFDIKLAGLVITGDIEGFDYQFHAIFGGSSAKLLDQWVGYKFNSQFKLKVGQFLIPISQENLTPSVKLETINFSQVVEALVSRSKDVIGNQCVRDVGIQVEGRGLFDYAIGVFNGSGISTPDTNNHKDIAGRLVFHPLKNLSIGGSYYTGKYTLSTDTTLSKNTRDRIGAEICYVKDTVSLKAEYLKGKDSVTKKDGWYVQAGYFIIPGKFQNIIKFDTYDPDTGIDGDETDIYTYGINLYFNKSVFLQVNYELKNERGTEISNNALTGQVTCQF